MQILIVVSSVFSNGGRQFREGAFLNKISPNTKTLVFHRYEKVRRNLKGDPLVTVVVKRTGGTLKNTALT